ncbi:MULTISPECIES: hypothetical protein [Streptomyces]|uniref:hypothetical protein n=1 Tax=Streptomyces TaxID=1883 RepID=UPI003322AA53
MLRGEDVRVVMFGCQTWGRRTPHAFLDPAHDRATAVADPHGCMPDPILHLERDGAPA